MGLFRSSRSATPMPTARAWPCTWPVCLGRRRAGPCWSFTTTRSCRRLENLRQEFAANVSHELKTPLSTIKACVETLLDGAMDDPIAPAAVPRADRGPVRPAASADSRPAAPVAHRIGNGSLLARRAGPGGGGGGVPGTPSHRGREQEPKAAGAAAAGSSARSSPGRTRRPSSRSSTTWSTTP